MNKQWNSKIQFPSDSDFIIRITKATHGPSKASNNPMYTIEWELAAPSEKEIGGEVYSLAGIQSGPMNHLYWTTKTIGDDEKSAANLERLTGQGEQPGVLRLLLADHPDLLENFNPENPDKAIEQALKGKLVLVQMSPDTNFVRKNPTKEQIEAAKKTGKRPEGDIQIHPVTGAKLVTYLPKVREIFGLAPEGALSAGSSY